MYAMWYDRQGPAAEVLQLGELPDPQPGPGEVRVQVRFSGVNPGDTKKRRGWLGSSMPYPRVIPHSDASGVIDEVGEDVDDRRVGSRVWIYGAQSYRPFGTAAQFAVVPSQLAVDLPDTVSDALGACLGIPGVTAHRAVFADGPVTGTTILVHGLLGGVAALAAQLAAWAGATVIGTVRRTSDLDQVRNSSAAHVIALDQPDPAAAIREAAGGGVDRIIEVAFSENIDLDVAVVKNNAIIAAYATVMTGLIFRSGRCCSTTSPSGCWAATTSRSAPSTRRRKTSRWQRSRALSQFRSVIRCPWPRQRWPTIGSTPAPAAGCW